MEEVGPNKDTGSLVFLVKPYFDFLHGLFSEIGVVSPDRLDGLLLGAALGLGDIELFEDDDQRDDAAQKHVDDQDDVQDAEEVRRYHVRAESSAGLD